MLPRGIILLWAGAVVDIPSGFVICDGTLGTPDLRDRFVPGAGGIYNPGDAGGATVHTHTFTSDGHFHDLLTPGGIQGGAPWSVRTNTVPGTGTTDNGNSLPPYYALCYIMKT